MISYQQFERNVLSVIFLVGMSLYAALLQATIFYCLVTVQWVGALKAILGLCLLLGVTYVGYKILRWIERQV